MVDGYGHWLTWLASRAPWIRWRRRQPASRGQRLLAYAEHLPLTVAPFTVAARIEQVGNAMRALAPGMRLALDPARRRPHAGPGGAGPRQARPAAIAGSTGCAGKTLMAEPTIPPRAGRPIAPRRSATGC